MDALEEALTVWRGRQWRLNHGPAFAEAAFHDVVLTRTGFGGPSSNVALDVHAHRMARHGLESSWA